MKRERKKSGSIVGRRIPKFVGTRELDEDRRKVDHERRMKNDKKYRETYLRNPKTI